MARALASPISNYKHRDVRTESSDLLSVLDELNTDALSDSGVGLLGLDANLLENDSLSVGRATERRGLEGGSEGTLLVSQIGPSVLPSGVSQLASRVQSTRHGCCDIFVSFVNSEDSTGTEDEKDEKNRERAVEQSRCPSSEPEARTDL